VAVVLTLVQTKHIRINIRKLNNTKNTVNTSTHVNKNPTDATVCRYLFTAKLPYVFRVSQHPSSGVLKTVTAATGTGHTTCTATPLQRGLIGTQSRSDHKYTSTHITKTPTHYKTS